MRSSRESSDSRDGRHRDSRREDRERRTASLGSSLTSPAIKRTKTSTHSSNNSIEKTGSGSSAKSSQNSQKEKQLTDKFDCYKTSMNAVRAEEEEAISNRDSTQDLEEFESKCESIREICRKVLELKKGNDSDNNGLQKLKTNGSFLFLGLKALNRFDKYRCREAKDKLQTAKQKVDTFQLQLQNMLYEVMHLQKECKTCQTFKSKDESIELVTIDRFQTEAPEELTERNVNSHSLHLARLEWELRQRKQLEEEVKSAQSVKKSMEEEIISKKETLEKLQPTLKSIVDATQPLYSQLNIPLQANDSIHALAQYLPRPLYVLYVQAISYKHAIKAKINIKIIGSLEDVKLFELNSKEVEENDDNEEQDDEEIHRKTKKSRHRKSVSSLTKSTAKSSRFNKLVASHPLTVEISFQINDSTLICVFNYLLRLEIVSVKVSVNQSESLNHNEVINESLLSQLLSNSDDGQCSPNPANDYVIKFYGSQSFTSLIPQIGFGYEWCQKLSGLDFITSSAKHTSIDLSIASMDLTIKAIIERFKSRIILQQQLCQLDSSSVSLPKELVALTYSQVNCVIKEFEQLTKEDLLALCRFNDAIDSNAINIDDSFIYKSRLERVSASLTALIIIAYDYPKIPPYFLISISSHFDHKTSDSSLRELEEILNCWCPQNIPDSCAHEILSYQMHKLQLGFDIYLEANQSTSVGTEGPKEFCQKKNLTALKNGRDHCIPFHYDPQCNLFIA